MKKVQHIAMALAGLVAYNTIATADPSFVVSHIDVKGIAKVSSNTVLSYLPIKVGQTFDYSRSGDVIKALYETHFFTNVKLERQGNTLILDLTERPTISDIKLTGNKQIPTDKLNDVLNNLGIQKGQFLDHATLQEVSQALTNQYYAMGYYNVKIDVEQTNESLNRVGVNIDISEGSVAKVAGITVVGNTVFNTQTLTEQLPLTTSTFTSFFTHSDEYSADKLQQSEEALRGYYMDHGYVNMKIDNATVSLTPDRKQVYVILKITEGPRYYFAGYQLVGTLLDKSALFERTISLKSGDVFSRQAIINAVQGMTTILGDDGYAFARINPTPKIDDKKLTVYVSFDVEPGQRYYVRRINFSGNTDTSQLALRGQFYQMEGGLYSGSAIQNSSFRLQQNSYLQSPGGVTVTPTPVAGSDDLLDLDVKVAEKLSAQLQFSFGYSQAYGFLLSAGITQPNFMGTGKSLGFSINTSAYQNSFSINYTNPFYTPDGVSRTISLYGTKTNSDELTIANYSTDSYGVNVSYGFPLSVYSSLNLGYGLGYTDLNIPNSTCSGTAAQSVYQHFACQYGTVYKQLLLTAGWSSNSTDNPMWPNKGRSQELDLTVSAPVDQEALQYYKISYTDDYYRPLGNSSFIFHPHAIVAFGDGYGFMHQLPFFQNYYAGGLGVQGLNRAYYPLSLGPVDPVSSQQIGGNLLVSGMLSVILPPLFDATSLRTSLYLDGGNVFDTHNPAYQFNVSQLRYSYGAQVEWMTPLNLPLIFSLGFPINTQRGDQLDPFQFTIGTVF